MKNFKDLVYLYRKDIPTDELPGMFVSPVLQNKKLGFSPR